ncbi:UDP-N-acetylglucosamine 2-epimerase (hydrolyzing) [Clostridiaceae bacterium]|nr:UDP-N-acetylglucosamine 2-epimerase (hydrolyzing) [Clostridiaceae bacterium]RKI08573.1 UDP-N-acetylglucosamine 2-epimerase (hydrolyzing) [bacterium 1XD21-70]
MKRKICVVTATRAEYGLLKRVILKLASSPFFDVQVAVTGTHLSPEFGLTYQEIEKDGITIHKKIEMLLSSDTSAAVSKSMGLALISFAEYFTESKPDAVLLLGDRYETLAVACAAMNEGIPIVHLHGGETTEGAVDEAFRHAVTKMSYLHMASTEEHRRRIIQMGEEPERVFCVGAMGVENALHTELMEKKELERELQIELDAPYGVVTFHPVTLEKDSARHQIEEVLGALEGFPNWKFLMTKANADKGGRIINQMTESYALSHGNVKVYDSLGMVRYLSAVRYSQMVIGNSSSGLIEVPSFHVPTVNIGDRQKGRIRADSVIDCIPEKKAIINAMKIADEAQFRQKVDATINPYGDGRTSDRIIAIMEEKLCRSEVNLKKKFYNIE